MPEPTYKEKNYSLTRGVVSKAYANASRKAAGSAEIGVEDDGYKAAEIQSLVDRFKKQDETYSGKVIKSIKPVGKQGV